MIFRNATVWKQNQWMKKDAVLVDGMLHFLDSDADTVSVSSDGNAVYNCLILPGFCDHISYIQMALLRFASSSSATESSQPKRCAS